MTKLSRYEEKLIREQFKAAEERIIEKIHARMIDLVKDEDLRIKTEKDIKRKFK